MLCYSNYEDTPSYRNNSGNREVVHHTSTVYVARPEDQELIQKLLKENKHLEAGLCATISELEKRGLANEILPEASRKGLIDLMTFWYEHQQSDEVRLSNELHKFSIHEQEVLRKILNETTEK